ncbi:MAG: alpha/beta hydrolase, partial [Dehalococcoidia bacterium]
MTGQRGTQEERLAFACGELSLEGVLHRPEASPLAAVVVCHPHPLYGGDMDNQVVVSICRELAATGLTALRFNFRGVGASQGSFGGGVGEQE